MVKGDKIIWDSGFGYDIGYYLKDIEQMSCSGQSYMVSGPIGGKFTDYSGRFLPFTKEKVDELNKKYEYPETWEYNYLVARLEKKLELDEELKLLLK